jgi:2,4-dienoyl-CoA reductase-like NADH-dependent reductase (Old Yellow Enzyme family)/thioredoxin reductase
LNIKKEVHMFEELFEPIYIGNVKIKNKLMMSPMVAHYAGSRGEVTDRMLRYYEERAKGGTGLILVETTLVHPDGRAIVRNPGMFSDELIPGWSQFVDAMHLHGARVGVQLGYGGNQGPDMLKELVSASAVPRKNKPARTPRELTIDEIEELIEAWAEAALRAKYAGFDFVQEHGSHGYLITQFCSPLTNRRTDEYGADRDLFAVKILRRIKEKCGEDYPVIYRLNSCEFVDGGITIEDAKRTAKRLEEAGMDAFDVTGGTNDSFDYFLPPVYSDSEDFYEFTKNASEIKKVVSVPVISGGLIVSPEKAVKAIKEGYVDMVFLGRALMADPDWAKKAKKGRVEEIKPCIGDMDGCVQRLFEVKSTWCTVNPFMGWEYRFGSSPGIAKEKKRVVVVGGGPGGMEAALIAAQRGHYVTLMEKDEELGGLLMIAAVPCNKKRFKSLIDWYKLQLPKAGVKIELGKKATVDSVVKKKPDVVIVATGSSPQGNRIEGANNAITADEFLLNKAKIGKRVVIVGGGHVGCELAVHISKNKAGGEITVLEALNDYLRDAGMVERVALERMLARSKVRIMVNTPVKRINKEEVIIEDKKGKESSMPADTIILATGRDPVCELEEELRGKVSEVHCVGDCISPRRILAAIHEGFGASMFI